MSKISYYVADCETNGLSTTNHEVCEISIIRCSDKIQITRNIRVERPELSSLDALAVTKKTLADLSYGESKEKVVEEIDSFFNEDGLKNSFRCLICHNANFDRKFLHALWEKCGKTFPVNLWIDTIPLTRNAAKAQGIIKPKVNLEAACDLFGIKKTATFHNAKMDTRNTFFLWKKLTEDMNIDYINQIKNIPHAKKDAEEDMDLDSEI